MRTAKHKQVAYHCDGVEMGTPLRSTDVAGGSKVEAGLAVRFLRGAFRRPAESSIDTVSSYIGESAEVASGRVWGIVDPSTMAVDVVEDTAPVEELTLPDEWITKRTFSITSTLPPGTTITGTDLLQATMSDKEMQYSDAIAWQYWFASINDLAERNDRDARTRGRTISQSPLAQQDILADSAELLADAAEATELSIPSEDSSPADTPVMQGLPAAARASP